MRSILLLALFSLSFGLTVICLFINRIHIEDQIQQELASDLARSVTSFDQQQRQQLSMLARQASLLANIPNLKALLTTHDERTIADESYSFWKLSGSGFFALLRDDGKLITYFNDGDKLDRSSVTREMSAYSELEDAPRIVAFKNRLFAVSVQPLFFGPANKGFCLGYVAIGYAMDNPLASRLRQVAEAEVILSGNGQIAASTLSGDLDDKLRVSNPTLLDREVSGQNVTIANGHYLATSIRLPSTGDNSVHLVVLKSFEQASIFLYRINRWITLLGAVSVLIAGILAVDIARRITRPLEVLALGARALAEGDFHYEIPDRGAAEIRELNRTFDSMRKEILEAQQRLIESERLVTIGRMARSVSHDLRHHLSAIYANAEFLALGKSGKTEKVEFLSEISFAIHDMTDLLDSLLMFSQTGHTLPMKEEPIDAILRYAIQLVRPHPDARGVRITVASESPEFVCADAKRLSRAIYNLLLNACQAARRGDVSPHVEIWVDTGLEDGREVLYVNIADNGPGISASIRETMFLPFSSEGKENGTGLGLTLALHLAQEHGGTVVVAASEPGRAILRLSLPRALPSAQTVPEDSSPEESRMDRPGGIR